ncbi:Clp protease N-terminal domain-containing protein [Pseudonocardia nigra]|uniref:Clp protease N-terminal domain-containing protein n=1 Tax=Pseudonocardia nigra TaxID=1921578 RepID=UPI001C606595|nr:Clp protease N-terminal domain-containing protein [Pseudonocardia nigra]
MFERFTGEARRVVVLAQEQARDLGHNYIGTEHLLLGVVHLPDDVGVRRALDRLGCTASAVRAAAEQMIGCGEPTTGRSGHIPFTPRAKEVLELSLREALRRGDNHIGPEHLVLAILTEGRGVAAKILTQVGGPSSEIRAAVIAAGKRSGASPAGPRTPAADQVLALAEQLAAGAPLGSHHLLEALARLDSSMAGRALASLGVTQDAVTERIDALDVAGTADATPEQAAAATMRWEIDADGAALRITDPDTVAALRRITDDAGGTLEGGGALAGPFITLFRAIQQAIEAFEAALNPQPDAAPARSTLRDRLRGRRRP